MAAASLKLPLLGMGVLLVAGVASWMVFSSDEEPAPFPVTPLQAHGQSPEQPVFRGAPAEPRTGAAEALAAEPAGLAPAGDVPSGARTPEAQAAQAGTAVIDVSGRVVDAGGRAIEGATVSFHESAFLLTAFRGPGNEATPSAPAPSALTGRDGTFTLRAPLPAKSDLLGDLVLPGMSPHLAVRHDVFATLVSPLAQVAPGALDVGTLVMEPGAWIIGRAVDSAGRPVAGATATARSEAGGGRERRGPGGMSGSLGDSLGSVNTGADGRFTVRGLSAGEGSLTVQKQGLRLGAKSDLELTARAPLDVGDVLLETGAVIAGVVLDSEGQPIEAADVSVSSMARIVVNRIEDLPRQQIGHEFGQRARTDEHGRFELGGLAGGTYTVHVTAPGHAGLSREDVPAGTRNLTLEPERLGSLLVTLTDSEDGRAIDGARIKATHVGEGGMGGWRDEVSATVVAGADALKSAGLAGDEPAAGVYLVQASGLSGTRLVVAAEGYATQELMAPAANADALVRFAAQLVPAAVVAGLVLDENRQPVEGAVVQLTADRPAEDGIVDFGGGRREARRSMRFSRGPEEPDSDLDAKRLTARTGADGRFELAGASSGDWNLVASAGGFVTTAAQRLSLQAGQSQRDLLLELARAGTLAGTVTEVDGAPVADIEVSVVPAGAAAPQAPGGPEGQRELSIARMFGRGEVEGERRARTRPDGTYSIEGLPPGDYVARLGGGPRRGLNVGAALVLTMDGMGGDGGSQPNVAVRIAAGQETRMDFVRPRRGSIRGRVIAGGAAVPGVTVSMRRTGGMPFGGERAATDERGEFRFHDVEAGSYDLTAQAPGAALERRQTVVCEAGQEHLADLVFTGATLSGIVKDGESGAGVEGVQLTLSPARGGDEVVESMAFSFVMAGPGGGPPGGMNMTINGGPTGARTDAGGRFELKYVEPGTYSLEAKGAGYMPAAQDGIEVMEGVHQSDLELVALRGGVIEGRVRSGTTGAALDTVPVRLRTTGESQMDVTENGGRFRFDGLEPGEYTLEALGSGFSSGGAIASESVTVLAGETASVDLSTEG